MKNVFTKQNLILQIASFIHEMKRLGNLMLGHGK